MSFETEAYSDEEFLVNAEAGAERESSVENEEEYEPVTDSRAAEITVHESDPGMQAVLEQKGGEPGDWSLEYQGASGYRFDGEHVRDPEGKIWTNEDAALHREMLAQWKEGGSAIFFLPDHRERTDTGEVLYVTQLILGEKGDVSYEIHKHETTFEREREITETGEEHSMASVERSGDELAAEQSVPDSWLLDLLGSDTFGMQTNAEAESRMTEMQVVAQERTHEAEALPITIVSEARGMNQSDAGSVPTQGAENILRALGMQLPIHPVPRSGGAAQHAARALNHQRRGNSSVMMERSA